MKKQTKIWFSLICCSLLVFSMPLTAFAADSAIIFEGGSTGFDFQPGSEYTATDLFDNFKDVMPGDVLTEEITIKNNANDCDYIHLYIRAFSHDENGNPLTYSESFENKDGNDQADVAGQRDETVATMADFLAQLSMKVYNNGTLIYEASPDELDRLTENVFLGSYENGDTGKLKVELAVPLSLGNEYANRVGEVDWVFTVEAHNYPEPQPDPTPQPDSTLQPSPKTGDTSNIFIYVGVTGVSVLFLILLVIFRKRSQKENK